MNGSKICCKLCNRPLKDKKSIEKGCGKTCEEKLKLYNGGVKLSKWLQNKD